MPKLLHSQNVGGFALQLIQSDDGNVFAVKYGEQVTNNLNYEQAATEYGLCLMHALACNGELIIEG